MAALSGRARTEKSACVRLPVAANSNVYIQFLGVVAILQIHCVFTVPAALRLPSSVGWSIGRRFVEHEYHPDGFVHDVLAAGHRERHEGQQVSIAVLVFVA